MHPKQQNQFIIIFSPIRKIIRSTLQHVYSK